MGSVWTDRALHVWAEPPKNLFQSVPLGPVAANSATPCATCLLKEGSSRLTQRIGDGGWAGVRPSYPLTSFKSPVKAFLTLEELRISASSYPYCPVPGFWPVGSYPLGLNHWMWDFSGEKCGICKRSLKAQWPQTNSKSTASWIQGTWGQGCISQVENA